MFDSDIWNNIDVDDLWVYDKLILSRKLGHKCGPAGVDLPTPGTYIVKPITNIEGMGLGTYIHTFDTVKTDILQPGTFWMEIFDGRHLSIDIVDGEVDVVYEGIRNSPQRFSKWVKLEEEVLYPSFLNDLSKKYGIVNYESIGGKIIEVHLRCNPDWIKHRAKELIPVWKEQPELTSSKNFVYDEDGDRIGFIVTPL